MTILDLATALDAAEGLQAAKLQRSQPTGPRKTPGAGPDRQMPYIAAIPARELFVDRTYQRPLEAARVDRMVQAWDPTMLGVLDVADRGDDQYPRYAIVAGQHRHQAATLADPRGGDVPLVCNVHRGLDPAGEAQLMHDLDRTQKKLTGHDQWRARRAAGDERVLAVEQVAARHGLRVEANRGDGILPCYGAAEQLLAIGGDQLLHNTLAVLCAAYGGAGAAWQAPLVTGVGRYLQEQGSAVDLDRLTRTLSANRPEQLRAQASALREIEPGSLSVLMTRVIATQYRRTPAAKSGGRS